MWNLPEHTTEHLLDGSLKVFQPRTGYRFSLEVFLLAGFISPRPQEKLLELGAGCGVISLIVAFRYKFKFLVGLEIQKELLKFFAHNIKISKFSEKVYPLLGDVKKPPFKAGSFEVVFTNPPYYPVGSGRLSPDLQERLARHEILASLQDFISCAACTLKNKGRFYLVHSARRLPEIINTCLKKRLMPKTLRLVYSYPGSEGKLVLLEAVKNGGAELKVLPPLFVYENRGGDYSEEMKRLFAL
ncbi:methyltransferase small [Thermodesulfatator indicus DSM 15286]|uniref:Methyltransferase small n=1 Tax=Thermodesulfatator indicus (strain DSM 15286 / JCM 11887 / CIR29812) TaxID=667014 RepID=F8ADQ3_THEID|nr:methyltransferase [Thermodesulfatator indicus]AEH46011.1 methyltransferase small [Thermodesulfatator indicus DSM 15286]